MKKGSKILIVAIPLMIILLGAVIYQYGYLRVRTELTALEDTTSVKSKTLEKYMNLIAEKPRIEERLNALRETRKAENW
jgi:cell division protein FtsL